jgi:hypothetical protein
MRARDPVLSLPGVVTVLPGPPLGGATSISPLTLPVGVAVDVVGLVAWEGGLVPPVPGFGVALLLPDPVAAGPFDVVLDDC